MTNFLWIAAHGELALWIAAFFLLFFHNGNSFAESASYALISTLMLFSFIFQISFILGVPQASLFAETVLSIGALITIWRFRKHYKCLVNIIKFVIIKQTLAFFAILAAFGYLAFLACSTIPEVGYQDLFETIRIFEHHKTFFLSDDSQKIQALLPMNTVILSHLFLRANSQIGTGLIGFLAYLSIGFSTYALSRRYAWPETAFTVTLITLSLTRLVFLSTTPGIEILPAAISLFCILAIYRSLEHPDIRDMIILILGIFFSVSAKFLCLAFPAILIILACVLFVRRHGKITWTSLLKKHWKISLLAIIPVFIFSQAWLFLYNFLEYGKWLGPLKISVMPIKDNVLLGAVANLVRYLFESLQLTWPLNSILNWIFGFSFNGFLFKIYNILFLPVFGTSGAETPFVFSWVQTGQLSWFGPFGILFVVPSIVVSIFRAHRRLKAIAIALAGYVYIVTLVVAWKPGNAEYFTLVFTCGGFCVSFLLPPWRFTTAGKKILQVISIMLLVYVCLFNTSKTFFHLPEIKEPSPTYDQFQSLSPKPEYVGKKLVCATGTFHSLYFHESIK